jgi:hypothetical protein
MRSGIDDPSKYELLFIEYTNCDIDYEFIYMLEKRRVIDKFPDWFLMQKHSNYYLPICEGIGRLFLNVQGLMYNWDSFCEYLYEIEDRKYDTLLTIFK